MNFILYNFDRATWSTGPLQSSAKTTLRKLGKQISFSSFDWSDLSFSKKKMSSSKKNEVLEYFETHKVQLLLEQALHECFKKKEKDPVLFLVRFPIVHFIRTLTSQRKRRQGRI